MPQLPGRLGDPAMTLLSDPRLDPRIKAVMEMAGDLAPGVTAPTTELSAEDALAYCNAFEAAGAAMHDMARAAMPAFDDVAQSQETITGVDGNTITLHIHRPKNQSGPLPCIVHTHGGGMVLMTAEDPGFTRLRNDLARAGNVVVGIEFRNGGGRLGNHPFPAGLNDCASGVQWVHEQRNALQLASIVISGESGGGNLAIATTLKAKQEGWLDQIDGVFAMCPYISGQYLPASPDLPSLIENDDYMLSGPTMAAMVKVYDPEEQHGSNPLAWPLHANSEDLTGLPPHIVSVNELDPLRDEGLTFYRKLLDAGVSAVARTVHGTPHAGDGSFPDFVPDIYQDTVRSISGFARSLAG